MSLSSEFLQANPPTEFAEVKGYSQEIAEQGAIRFNEWLTKEGYTCPSNLNIVAEFLDTNEWPITYRNLRIAYFWTRAEGLLIYDTPESKTIPTIGKARAYLHKHFPTLKPNGNEFNQELSRIMREGIEDEGAATKYSGVRVERIVKSPENQQAEVDEVARLRSLDANSPRSKKKVSVGEDLRREYQQSLQENKNGGKKRHMSEGEARAEISRTMPNLKIGSSEYNMWTARLQFNQNSDD